MKTILSGIQTWTRGEIHKSTADWSQNDPNADNYIKNRTHWEEVKTEEKLVDNLTSENYKAGIDVPKCTFIPGQKYTVVWNDVLYKDLVCYNNGEFNIIADGSSTPFGIDDNGGNGLYIEYHEEDEEGNDLPFTVSISIVPIIIHKLDSKYIPTNLATTDDVDEVWNFAGDAYDLASKKMNKSNPIGSGSFSLNRDQSGITGQYSSAIGYNCSAQGSYSEASGLQTKATGEAQKVGGKYNLEEAPYIQKIKEAKFTLSPTSTGGIFYAYVASDFTFDPLTGLFTLINPTYEVVGTAIFIHELGYVSRSITSRSIYKGYRSWSGSSIKTIDTYEYYGEKNPYLSACIVGNGTSDTERSNAHTLDWEGNAWYSGDVYVGSTSGINKDDGSKKLATEEYVVGKIESMDIMPEDIIEWMTEEGAITPLASTGGQLYTTNDNKILII